MFSEGDCRIPGMHHSARPDFFICIGIHNSFSHNTGFLAGKAANEFSSINLAHHLLFDLRLKGDVATMMDGPRFTVHKPLARNLTLHEECRQVTGEILP
jgi:hypothetical protein